MGPRAIQEMFVKGLIVDVVHLVQDAHTSTDVPTALKQDMVSITVGREQQIIRNVNNVMECSLIKMVLTHLVRGFP